MPSGSSETRSRKRNRSKSSSSRSRSPPPARDRRPAKGGHKRSEVSKPSDAVSKGSDHKSRRKHDRDSSSTKRSRSAESGRRSSPPRRRRDDDFGRRRRSADRDRGYDDRPRRSRFVPHVRVKQEPTSDEEEDRRRQRRQRIKQEADDVGANSKPAEDKPKETVNFGLSGKLAEDTNVFNGVVIKYNEPLEARKPNKRWRLYPFKGDQPLPMLPIHRQSAYLLGRERRVADIPIDHPSCSKQHAVLQFRSVPYEKEDGRKGRRIKPYIIDLESANGTFVNNNKVESRRYVELFEKDVVKFGFSTREYVLLHEGSVKDDDDDLSEKPGDEDGEEGSTEVQGSATQSDAEPVTEAVS